MKCTSWAALDDSAGAAHHHPEHALATPSDHRIAEANVGLPSDSVHRPTHRGWPSAGRSPPGTGGGRCVECIGPSHDDSSNTCLAGSCSTGERLPDRGRGRAPGAVPPTRAKVRPRTKARAKSGTGPRPGPGTGPGPGPPLSTDRRNRPPRNRPARRRPGRGRSSGSPGAPRDAPRGCPGPWLRPSSWHTTERPGGRGHAGRSPARRTSEVPAARSEL